jgi:NAD(P)-dependent dehydrogenase (short-subunit alcohol dehydrogenase family)
MTRVGIVTGAAGGFGTAIAERLRADGLEVVAADLPDLDVGDPASVDRVGCRETRSSCRSGEFVLVDDAAEQVASRDPRRQRRRRRANG